MPFVWHDVGNARYDVDNRDHGTDPSLIAVSEALGMDPEE